MADVIRDVLIRVGVEQKESTLRVPAVEQTIQKQVATAEKQATATKQSETFKRIQLSERLAAAERNRFDEAARLEREGAELAAQNAGKKTRAADDSTNSLAKQQRAIEKLSRGAIQAAQGFGQLARGAALIGASDQDVEKLVQSLVKIQAGYDVAQGGLKIFKGVNDTLEKGAAVAPKFAGAIGLVGGAALPIAALGVAVLALADTYDVFGRHAEAAARRHQAAVAGIAAREKTLRSEQDKNIGQKAGLLTGLLDTRRFADELGIGKGSEARVASVENTFAREKVRLLEDESIRQQKLDVLRKDRLRTTEEIQKAEDKLANTALRTTKELAVNTTGTIFKETKTATIETKDIGQSVERRAATEKFIADATKRRIDNLREEGELLKANLATRVAERDKLRSAQEEIGRLSAGEQAFAASLAKRLQGGGGTKEQADELARLLPNLSQGLLSDFFANRGASDSAGLLDIFNVKKVQGHEIAAAVSALEQNIAEQEKQGGDLVTTATRATNTMFEVLRRLEEIAANTAARLAEFLQNKG